jgi:hypothetical protein
VTIDGTSRRAALLCLAFVAAAGCGGDPHSARGVAELFLDAHYVLIDLPRALGHTTGVAQAKVEHEIELTQGLTIDDSVQKPTVHYRLVEEHPDGDAASNFLYAADITAGGDSFARRWMVTVRRQDVGWRVTNFQELHEEPAAADDAR